MLACNGLDFVFPVDCVAIEGGTADVLEEFVGHDGFRFVEKVVKGFSVVFFKQLEALLTLRVGLSLMRSGF
jgi:hypothetical protein